METRHPVLSSPRTKTLSPAHPLLGRRARSGSNSRGDRSPAQLQQNLASRKISTCQLMPSSLKMMSNGKYSGPSPWKRFYFIFPGRFCSWSSSQKPHRSEAHQAGMLFLFPTADDTIVFLPPATRRSPSFFYGAILLQKSPVEVFPTSSLAEGCFPTGKVSVLTPVGLQSK